MPNMSYCKFQNTFSDLIDCASTLNENHYSEVFENLSTSERAAAKNLIELATEIAHNFYLPDEDCFVWDLDNK